MLVMPMSHDQFDNAAILRRLHVGDWLSVRKFTPRRIAAKLSALLDSSQTRSASDRLATLAHADNGTAKACDLIEAIR
jgi:rhamnosyltransferase subunit B